MQSTTHSPSSISITSKGDMPVLELGAVEPGAATMEVSASQTQLPLETHPVQPMSLNSIGMLIPGAVPFEPQEDAAQLLASHPTCSDDESEPGSVQAQPAAVQTERKQTPSKAQDKPPVSSGQAPQRQEMADGEYRSVYSLRFGRGTPECQTCAECCAGYGVCFLGLSVGVWACHCPHAVPFAITGGSMAGVALVHGLAKDWGCIPEIHSETVYQPRRSA